VRKGKGKLAYALAKTIAGRNETNGWGEQTFRLRNAWLMTHSNQKEKGTRKGERGKGKQHSGVVVGRGRKVRTWEEKIRGRYG